MKKRDLINLVKLNIVDNMKVLDLFKLSNKEVNLILLHQKKAKFIYDFINQIKGYEKIYGHTLDIMESINDTDLLVMFCNRIIRYINLESNRYKLVLLMFRGIDDLKGFERICNLLDNSNSSINYLGEALIYYDQTLLDSVYYKDILNSLYYLQNDKIYLLLKEILDEIRDNDLKEYALSSIATIFIQKDINIVINNLNKLLDEVKKHKQLYTLNGKCKISEILSNPKNLKHLNRILKEVGNDEELTIDSYVKRI